MQNQNKIWAHFQNKKPMSFEGANPRMNYFIKFIQNKKNDITPRILNIGAGSGYLEEKALKLGWYIFSLDPDDSTVERLQSKGINAKTGYVEKIPFKNEKFDFVIASEILEHLDDHQFKQGVKEIFRVLKHSGWLAGTVPYCEELSLNQAVCPDCGNVFHRWGHQKAFDIKSIQNELKEYCNKLVIKKTVFVSFKDRNFIGKIKSFFRWLLGRSGALIAGPSILFLCKK